jgi:hypothetical protein
MDQKPISLLFILIALVGFARTGALAGSLELFLGGSVQVTIGPPEAVALGVGFGIDNLPLRPSGTAESNLAPGKHAIRFRPLTGWIEPPRRDLLIVGGSERILSFDYRPLPAYYLKAIPPQTARPGAPLRFVVLSSDPADPASLPAGTRLAFGVAPQPAGALSFDQVSGELRYQVDPQDRRDFTVFFFGVGPSGPVNGSAVITPAPELPPEDAVLHFERPLPDPASKDYIQIRESMTATPETFNWRQINPRSVSISGRLLIFEAASPVSDLFDRYDSDTDLKDLKLYSETVIIRSPLRLPGTHVEIHARELRFEGNGSLDVTPVHNTAGNPDPDGVAPEEVVPHGADGANGLSSPPLEVYLEKLHSDPGPKPAVTPVRFFLRGGNAQEAGNGRDGNDVVRPGTRLCGTFMNNPVIYWSCDGFVTCSAREVFGEDSIPSGTPGKGGPGGTFTSPWTGIDLASLVSLAGGQHGRPGIDTVGGLPPGRFAIVDALTGPRIDDPPCGRVHVEYVDAIPGTSYTAPQHPCCGGDGGAIKRSAPGAWLHPLLVRSTLLYVRDAYLDSRIPEARAILEEYRTLISTLKGRLLPGDEKDQFFQLSEEIESLLHRIDSNLDYFGNPVTWVPMLSFEANLSAFTEEVERAIPILYLAHWVKHAAQGAQATREAAIAAKSRLAKEIDDLVLEHAIAQEELPVLLGETEDLEVRMADLTVKLTLLEAELTRRAQENVNERHKLPFWRKAVGILGAVTKVVPLAQPALGYVGAGLSLLAKFDPDHPLANLSTLPDLLKTIKSNPYAACAGEKAKETKTDPKQESKQTLLARLKACQALMSPGVKEIRTILKEVQADKKEVEAELEKLRASDPVFAETTAELETLNGEKQRLAERLAAVLDKLAKFSSAVEEAQQAIDQLDRDLSAALDVMDHRSILYVADMGRRTADRLLNYQYLMAKAYQYRTLKPYTGNLHLGRILEEITKLVEFQNSTPVLSRSQFESLKGIYLEELGRIGEGILTDLNENPPDRSAPVSFRLTASEIGALNQQGSIEIDLAKKGLFGVAEENLRIASLSTQDLAVTQIGTIGTTATLRLKLEHSGISRITRQGQTYLFTHYRTERVNPITWSTVYDGLSRTLNESGISAAADSLLRAVLGLGESEDILLYSRPGALAKLVLSKEVTADNGVDFRVDGLTLKLNYDYAAGKGGIHELEVQVSDDLGPRILLDREDRNGRQDGLGSFTRTFDGPGTVRLEAPATHGVWNFDRWELDGGGAGGGEEPSRFLDVSLPSSRTARAVYRSTAPAGVAFRRGDSNGDGKMDITDAVNTLSFLFTGGVEPGCMDAADASDDGQVDITDVVASLGYLFLGSEPPPAPGPDSCGSDPSADELGPCIYESCR